jgi:hypothetical protein
VIWYSWKAITAPDPQRANATRLTGATSGSGCDLTGSANLRASSRRIRAARQPRALVPACARYCFSFAGSAVRDSPIVRKGAGRCLLYLPSVPFDQSLSQSFFQEDHGATEPTPVFSSTGTVEINGSRRRGWTYFAFATLTRSRR